MKNLLLLLLGGHDTVSTTMTSVVYYLHKYKDHREAIWEEIKWVLSDDPKNITVETLEEMTKLSYFIKEA